MNSQPQESPSLQTITVKHAFQKRRKYYHQQLYKAYRWVADDWTIYIYFIIPALFFLGKYYYDLWLNPPIWLLKIDPIFIALLFFVISLQHSMKYFYLRADQLTLLQNRSWLHELRKYGAMYSYIKQDIIWLICFLLLLPLLIISFPLTALEIISLYVFTITYTHITSLLSKEARLRFKARYIRAYPFIAVCSFIFLCGWYVTVFIFGQYYTYLIGSLINILLLAFLYQWGRSYLHTYFIPIVEQENTSSFAETMLRFSEDATDLKPPKHPYPKIFKRSQQLFKNRTFHNVLIETAIKRFVRSTNYVLNYFQLYGAATAGMLILSSLAGKLVLLAMVVYSSTLFVKQYWKKFTEHSFMSVYTFDKEVMKKGEWHFLFHLATPGVLIVILVMLLTLTL